MIPLTDTAARLDNRSGRRLQSRRSHQEEPRLLVSLLALGELYFSLIRLAVGRAAYRLVYGKEASY